MSATTRSQLASDIWEYVRTSDDAEKAIREVAALLISEGRARELELIMRDIERLRLDSDGVLEVHIASARPLPATVEQQLLELFDAESKHAVKEIDPSLIGGVRVQAQDQVIDLSVRARLRRLLHSATS